MRKVEKINELVWSRIAGVSFLLWAILDFLRKMFVWFFVTSSNISFDAFYPSFLIFVFFLVFSIFLASYISKGKSIGKVLGLLFVLSTFISPLNPLSLPSSYLLSSIALISAILILISFKENSFGKKISKK